jgi:hypothetical protein
MKKEKDLSTILLDIILFVASKLKYENQIKLLTSIPYFFILFITFLLIKVFGYSVLIYEIIFLSFAYYYYKKSNGIIFTFNFIEIPILFNTPKRKNSLRFVCISDTHNKTDELELPEGDVLLHSGDFTLEGKTEEGKKIF